MKRNISIPKADIKDQSLREALEVIERHAVNQQYVEENLLLRPGKIRTTVPRSEEGRDGDIHLFMDTDGSLYLAIKANGVWRKAKLEEF